MEYAPTIDLSPAFGGSLSNRTEVAMQIDSACRSTGFFVAIGHGVEKTLLEDVINTSREFLIRVIKVLLEKLKRKNQFYIMLPIIF